MLCAPLPGAPDDDRFDERRVGLDHLAVGVAGGREALELLERALRTLGADTDGIKPDRAGDQWMITFRDPDSIQWEFFQDD